MAAAALAAPHLPAAPRVLAYPRATVLLVAGIPGAGKTTFLRRTVHDPAVRVLDSDDVRRAWQARLGTVRGAALYRPLVHLAHTVRVVRAVLAGGTVVVHESGTRALLRRALARLAGGVGRPCHAVFLDAAPEAARAGQHRRTRRPISTRSMRRHVGAWHALRARLAADPGALRVEGFASALVLDRAEAAAVDAVHFS